MTDKQKEAPHEKTDNAENARRAVEAMAYIQRAIENCYSDVRCAIEEDERGQNNGRILERIERTLANALTLIELNTSHERQIVVL